MTLQLDQRAREAVIHGPPRKLVDGVAPTVMENIARRVAEAPDGLVRSFQADGSVREETFAELWRRSGDLAARFRSLGVGPGSQTVLLLGDLLDFVACFWASLRVGATPIPFGGVARAATAEELRNLVARLERPALIGDAPSADLDRLAALLPDAPILRLSSLPGRGAEGDSEELDPAAEPDIICLLPTSGSTGTVKLVMLDRRAILKRNFTQNYSAALNGHAMNVFPFEGISGLGAVFLRYASLTQLHSRALTARALAIFEAIERFAITNVHMTNSTAARLVEEAASEERNFDLSGLRIVGLGGETVTRLVATAFATLLRRNGAGDVLRAGYGSTETSSLLSGGDPSLCPLDEAGAPILSGAAAGISLRIVGDNGSTLGEGEAGHVEAFAPQTLFAGYWKEPELSRDCMTPDGWFKTGDLGAINDGGFSFRGRAKQTLVVGARKFSLDDIDSCLQSHADIGRRTVSFVVRGGADATDGLGIAVAVVEGEALDSVPTDKIRAALVRRYGLAPAIVTPIRTGEWPLTATGKVDRRALGERALKEASAEAVPRSPERVDEEVLASLWREALNLGRGFVFGDERSSGCGEDFGRDDNFFDSGGDSLRASTLLMGVEKRFKRQIALREFFELPTFDNLVRLVQSASAPPANDQDGTLWRLPYATTRGILSYVEAWNGERVSEDRLMLGANRHGSLPPLFCILQEGYEFEYLATSLGAQQPVYAFRSLAHVDNYDEDLVQALALRYVENIQRAHPDGPLFLLGYCQAGKLALPMAQHLIRRGRHLPLLILVDWTLEPVSYPGDVLLLFGQDRTYNPKFGPFNPEAAWRRMFGEFYYAEVDGYHDEDTLFHPNPVSLADEVAQRCAQALDRSRPFTPLKECAFELAVARAPRRAQPGARLCLEVRVRNVGKVPIGGESANLRLGGFWTRDGAIHGPRFIEAAPFPAIAPGDVSVLDACVMYRRTRAISTLRSVSSRSGRTR
jgi:acyl-CoA synthetase (AMP-forming)/AMP-acid ligase II/acyl carrier protein